MTSAAETVMTQYSTLPPAPTRAPPTQYNPYGPPTPTAADTSPVIDPHTGYISPHARDFRGCLGCGSEAHQYRDCLLNQTEPTHSTFTKNFLARYPDKRKYPPRPEEVTALIAVPPPATTAIDQGPSILRNQSPGGMGRGAGAVLPAWMTRIRDSTALAPATAPPKKVRLSTIMVKILQQSTTPSPPPLQPFPIRIDNKMPAITFCLGKSPDDSVSLVCLYDTCAALSTGNLLFHQWVVTTFPELVHSFVQFDDANPFEAIKLVGAVKDPADFDEETHGKLTAVVRYNLPYTDNDSHPIALCIALGADVSVNTILGWPAIEDLGIEMRIKENKFYSSTLDCTFHLERITAPFGLPEGTNFNPATDFMRPESSTPKQPRARAPTRTTAVTFDPSTQLRELCQRFNAKTRPNDLLAPGASDTMTMHARASGELDQTPISTQGYTILEDSTTHQQIPVSSTTPATEGYTHGAVPLPAS